MSDKEIMEYKSENGLYNATSNTELVLVAIAVELHRIANALEDQDK